MAHIPVMLQEILQLLAVDGGYVLDGTFGGGGHTRALLENAPSLRAVAIDCDPYASVRAEEVKATFGDRFAFHDLNFAQIEELDESGFTGALLDLGVSSFQLDTPERGFSFRNEAKADMRLDPRVGMSAAQFLERAPEKDLIYAVRDLGEEKAWRKVVTTIIKSRGLGVLENTLKLAELIKSVVEASTLGRRSKIHPATRTFQGIRMAVNHELESLEAALPAAYEKLAVGGVLAVITFHSLEDRIVKRFFKRLAGLPEHKQDERTLDERVAVAELLTKRPQTPTDEEIEANPRSRSAKLRAIKKINPISYAANVL